MMKDAMSAAKFELRKEAIELAIKAAAANGGAGPAAILAAAKQYEHYLVTGETTQSKPLVIPPDDPALEVRMA